MDSHSDQWLQRHVLAPAERSANGRDDFADHFRWAGQQVRKLADVILRPLGGNDQRQAAIVINVTQARFRLQISMLHVRRPVNPLDDHFGLRESRFHIATAHFDVTNQVATLFLVHQHPVVHRCARIGHRLQDLVPHPHQLACSLGGILALGNDHGYAVPGPARLASHRDQHLLVKGHYPILIHRHIVGSYDVHHPRQVARRRQVNLGHPRMRMSSPHHLGIQLPRHIEILGKTAPTGHFGNNVQPLDVTSNRVRHPPPSLSRRAANSIASTIW